MVTLRYKYLIVSYKAIIVEYKVTVENERELKSQLCIRTSH